MSNKEIHMVVRHPCGYCGTVLKVVTDVDCGLLIRFDETGDLERGEYVICDCGNHIWTQLDEEAQEWRIFEIRILNQ